MSTQTAIRASNQALRGRRQSNRSALKTIRNTPSPLVDNELSFGKWISRNERHVAD
jgi:hypothetical protein